MSHRLTYEQMREVIDRGESVWYNGAMLTMIEQLPSPYELAGSDTQAQADAIAEMKANIARQQAQLDELTGAESVDSTAPVDAKKQAQLDNLSKARAARASNRQRTDVGGELEPGAVPSEEVVAVPATDTEGNEVKP